MIVKLELICSSKLDKSLIVQLIIQSITIYLYRSMTLSYLSAEEVVSGSMEPQKTGAPGEKS